MTYLLLKDFVVVLRGSVGGSWNCLGWCRLGAGAGTVWWVVVEGGSRGGMMTRRSSGKVVDAVFLGKVVRRGIDGCS